MSNVFSAERAHAGVCFHGTKFQYYRDTLKEISRQRKLCHGTKRLSEDDLLSFTAPDNELDSTHSFTPVSAPAHTAAAPSSATATAPSQRFANDLSLSSVLLSLSVAYIYSLCCCSTMIIML